MPHSIRIERKCKTFIVTDDVMVRAFFLYPADWFQFTDCCSYKVSVQIAASFAQIVTHILQKAFFKHLLVYKKHICTEIHERQQKGSAAHLRRKRNVYE